jgi:release factor glutamine methyltransferase
MNLKDLKQQFISIIRINYDPEECTALFDLAATHTLKLSRSKLLTMNDLKIDPSDTESILQIAKQLQTGRPLQYILGEALFYGLKFYVNADVLIPRPETEELVYLIIQTIKGSAKPYKTLLDIGTGSGCIPISIKKNVPDLDVSALDVSRAALELAKRNGNLNEVILNFIEADILTYHAELAYDIIVSNPPYIKEEEKAAMHQNVLDHEPHLALFVSNEDPLVFYKAIADFSQQHLNKDGFLFFEINEFLGSEMIEMLSSKGFRNIQIIQDMQRKDRMISCQYH